MNATSQPLPPEWIAKLFTRFRSIYGNRTETMWGQANPDDLRATWADELAGFNGDDIRGALELARSEYLDYPPTLYEFASLCRIARAPRLRAEEDQRLRLSAPPTAPADPTVVAAVAEYARKIGRQQRDPKQWARDILAMNANGQYHWPQYVKDAREALGMTREDSQ